LYWNIPPILHMYEWNVYNLKSHQTWITATEMKKQRLLLVIYNIEISSIKFLEISISAKDKLKSNYLEDTLVLGMTGRLQRNIGDRAGLTHDENLHPLRYLTPRQHRCIHHLPVLKQNIKRSLSLAEEKLIELKLLFQFFSYLNSHSYF